MLIISLLLLIFLFLVVSYYRLPCWLSSVVFGVMLLAFSLGDQASNLFTIISFIIFIPIVLILNIAAVRRPLIINPAMAFLKKTKPSISETERVVLNAGNTWWEAKLFQGSPKWDDLLSMPVPILSSEEQAFLAGPVEALCHLIDRHKDKTDDYGLSLEIWEFLKREKFFAMVIEKSYGGLGFSAQGHSAVIKKIATRDLNAAVITMVPNSLGPAELLAHYGSPEQKNHYLPRLASGEDIPCFGLTSPHAGSDATSIVDAGVICKGMYQGQEIIGIKLNFEKRYITLSCVATLLGLAFKLFDPEHLLGQEENLGINIAIIPMNTPGIDNQRRHKPMHLLFPNGPIRGKDVFVPLDALLGGTAMIGQGWKMLAECLSIGRAISLPALSCASASLGYLTTGAYALIRKQFNLPLSAFEGIREVLTEIAGYTYMLEATRLFTASAVDQGLSPSVASAIAKYHMTEIQRKLLQNAMDIHAGKAIQVGPRNYFSQAYLGIPVGITVEGANILTRSLIIFGQGALRCHPHLLAEVAAAENTDSKAGLLQLDEALCGHTGYLFHNACKTFIDGLTGGLFIRAPSGPLSTYYKSLSRMSTALAFASDVTSVIMGAELKRKETLGARLGDVLSYLYLSSAVLKYFRDHGEQAEELPYVEWCLQKNLAAIQIAFDDFIQNFPNPLVRMTLKSSIFPWGRSYKKPSDHLTKPLLESMLTPSNFRNRLLSGCYQGDNASPWARTETAFNALLLTKAIEEKLKLAIKNKQCLYSGENEEQLKLALQHGVLSAEEVMQLQKTYALVEDAIAVDEYNLDFTKVLNS